MDLTKRNMTLVEYVVQFHHLEHYYPHIFSSELEKVGIFVWRLNKGLRPRVISNRLETLSESIEMATRLDENHARSYKGKK